MRKTAPTLQYWYVSRIQLVIYRLNPINGRQSTLNYRYLTPGLIIQIWLGTACWAIDGLVLINWYEMADKCFKFPIVHYLNLIRAQRNVKVSWRPSSGACSNWTSRADGRLLTDLNRLLRWLIKEMWLAFWPAAIARRFVSEFISWLEFAGCRHCVFLSSWRQICKWGEGPVDDDVITVTSRSDSSHLHLYGPWVGVAAASRQIPAKMSQDSTTFWKETLGEKKSLRNRSDARRWLAATDPESSRTFENFRESSRSWKSSLSQPQRGQVSFPAPEEPPPNPKWLD